MIERPALAPQFTAWVAPGEAMLLLSATRDCLLEGAVYEVLVPLLDGRATVDELADALADRVSAAEVWYAVRLLFAEGCLAERDALARTGGIPPGDVESPHLTRVVVRDLLDPALHVADARARESASAWMPVCDTGDALWIGPRFDGAHTEPCLLCLQQAILSGRPAAALVRYHMLARVGPPAAPVLVTAAQAAAMRTLETDTDSRRTIVSLDAAGRIVGQHPIPRRASCERCGTPAASRAADAAEPIDIDPLVLLEDTDGRERRAAAFLIRHAALLDSVTGIGRGVAKVPCVGCDAVHVYTGGANRARWSHDLATMRRDLRQHAGGKGRTDILARASLLGELAERSSAVHRGDEPSVVATAKELGERAIHPNDCMLFSDDQLDRADVLSTSSDRIPRRFAEDVPVGWTPVWSLTRAMTRYVPTGTLYFDYTPGRSEPYFVADSNGNAAGATREDAILQGLLELVERDAAGIWWYNRVRRPAVALHTLDDEWSERFVAQLVALGRDVWILDVTTELEIPVCVAVSRATTGVERPLLGFGAHVTQRDAALRALAELGQMTAVYGLFEDDDTRVDLPLREWMRLASVKRLPHLAPDGLRASMPRHDRLGTVRDAFERCRARLEGAGLECLVLDQTRDDIGIPVVKVIVPGLRHFRRRLAPGRLYDVPLQLGWTPVPVPEQAMNPAAFPF